MSTLERAIALAARAHAGQTDKAGAPYIFHPLRVMLAVNGDAEQLVAVLHDVVEDGGITLDRLRELGFTEPVVAAVDALTKRDDEHGAENYLSFVERAGQNDIARAVKMADIADNMDLSRIASPTEDDFTRLERYRAATRLLESIERDSLQAKRHAAKEKERLVSTLRRPTILPLREGISPDDVERACPDTGPIVACDFYVRGAEQGIAAPPGFTLYSLGIRYWNPGFGGRWNAGSNKRGGGTSIDPRDYASRLLARLIPVLTPRDACSAR